MKKAVSVDPQGREQFIEACISLLGAKARLMEDLEDVLEAAKKLDTKR